MTATPDTAQPARLPHGPAGRVVAATQTYARDIPATCLCGWEPAETRPGRVQWQRQWHQPGCPYHEGNQP